MFRTNLQAAFNVVRETREVEDPWGLGIVFDVYRDDAPTYQSRLTAIRLEDPMFAGAFNAVARAQMRALIEGREFGDEDFKAAALTQVDTTEVPADLVARMSEQGIRETALRIAGWRGLVDENGADVPFSPEHSLELLRSPEWVPEDRPLGGQTLGAALRALVTKEAIEHANEHAVYVEAAEKNSERSSAGAPTTSASSTT